MKYSKLLLPTLRESPAEAEIVSHKLMLRAGLIRKLSAGIYSYLPAGLRVLRKVENIIREEMNRAGAQEVLLPAVQPAELWQKSGRWDYYGKELLRFVDRHGRESCLGPTHEEVITDMVGREVQSYRHLPINLYQIQTKFRDEIRPRFGVMRAREFIMKDAYSFDADEAGAEQSYRAMFQAYHNIFNRCGLDFVAVEADSGTIGGSFSHEFMVLADSGEDAVAACKNCNYGANVEKAETLPATISDSVEASEFLPMKEVSTPGKKTIEEVAAFLGISEKETLKTLIFDTDKGLVAVCVRGDHEVNPAKVKNILEANSAELASEAAVLNATGAKVGFAGPVGLKIPLYLDHAVSDQCAFAAGANINETHFVNVRVGRDFKPAELADLRFIGGGDPCPKCGSPVTIRRGVEVGHVFKLGTKYSVSMGASFLDAEGVARPIIMGCYGIGVGRTAAAAIEQNHDENGIVWPVPVAPWHVVLVPLNVRNEEALNVAAEMTSAMEKAGIEVLVDDRDERPGVKFKDADLLGIPLRITLGPRGLKEGVAEVRIRKTGEDLTLPLAEAVGWVKTWLDDCLSQK